MAPIWHNKREEQQPEQCLFAYLGIVFQQFCQPINPLCASLSELKGTETEH